MPVAKGSKRTTNPSLRNPAKKVNLQARIREQRALELRLEGNTYAEIARKMNLTDCGVYNMIMRVLSKMNEDIREKIPEARQIELSRCDNFLKALYPKCKKGDTFAITTALKVAERRTRLMGLDVPVKVDALAGEGGALAIELFRKMLNDASASV